MPSSSFELISEKLVKPFFSTPPSLRNYKLSLLDQHLHKRYIPVAFFYPGRLDNTSHQTSSHDDLLEESLSKTLSYYYPFAGRLTDNISVNCNDMGVTFLEVRIRSPMSEILNEDDTRAQDIIFPTGLPWEAARDQPSLMVVQLSHFDCGGKALTVCLRHNIADGATLFNFINDWAAIARQSSEIPSPQFIGASILPPIDDPSIEGGDLKKGQTCITRRYIFDSEKLNQLKVKAADELEVQKPTRVEVVAALLYERAMFASAVCSGSFKPSVLVFLSNLRPLIGPPDTQNCVGNLVSSFPVVTTDQREINFSRLVTETRRGKIQLIEKYKGMTATALIADTLDSVEQVTRVQGMNDMDGYFCSSWCRFPTNNIDFGWGSPIRVSSTSSSYKNCFVLTDIPNGEGIEALVTLEEQVMSVFQKDPQILAFSSTSRFLEK